MNLTVLERLIVLNVLPAEGDILLLRTRQGMISKYGMSEEEIKEYEFKYDEGNATWRNDLPQEKEFDISDAEKGIIKDALVKLNKEHKLTANHVSLYEKFVE